MKLAELSTRDFAQQLSSGTPSPGGGAAVAFIGAQGAALVAMVAGLTTGRKKYLAFEEMANATREKALELKDQFILAMDQDSESYQMVNDVFAMPKVTQEEKEKRRETMQAALKFCTLPPHETMVLALAGIRLAHGLVGRSNTNAAGELAVAALSFKAAFEGAWLNVLINTNSLEDAAFVKYHRQQGRELHTDFLPIFEEITAWTQSLAEH